MRQAVHMHARKPDHVAAASKRHMTFTILENAHGYLFCQSSWGGGMEEQGLHSK